MSYHNLQIRVQEKDSIFEWCNAVTQAANNLYNAALYVERQLRSGLRKEPSERFENEKEVIKRVEDAISLMNIPRKKTYEKSKEKYESSTDPKKAEPKPNEFSMPTAEKPFVWYAFLDALFKATKNSDYLCEYLPRQTAQHVLKSVAQNIRSYCAASKKLQSGQDEFHRQAKVPQLS